MQIYDIWATLLQDKAAIILILLWIGWGAILLLWTMQSIWGDRLSLLEYISLAMGGWVLPIFLISLLVFVLGLVFNVHLELLNLFVLMFLSAGVATWSINHNKEKPKGKFLLLLFMGVTLLFLILLRLPFITRILLPPYFDSAEHYRIANILIKDYKNAGSGGYFIWPVSSYYHIGYHIILAVMTVTSQMKLDRMMLVFGQIALALVPIPLFFLVRRATRSNMAGLFAVVLGVFGWYMPAHGVNWGKYPALLSLLSVQFSIGILYLLSENERRGYKSRVIPGLAMLGIGVSFLIHVRSIIFIGIAVVAWKLAQGWEHLSQKAKFLFFGLVLLSLAGEIIYIERTSVLNTLLDPYFDDGIWITGAIGALSVFAYLRYRRLVFACLLFIMLLILNLFIPVSNNAFFTLMDRPFIEMTLFIPLSLLGGLGFASFNELSFLRLKLLKGVAVGLFSGLIMIYAFIHYNFYPSDCCEIIGNDDLIALDWMDKNLPQDARILISSAEIKITPFGQSPQNAGSDAGAWIAGLTDRATINLPYTIDFRETGILNRICGQEITHIYVGNSSQSFNPEILEQKPDWYKILLFLPNAKVYQVVGCT